MQYNENTDTFYYVGHHAFAPQNPIQLRNSIKGTADSCEIKNNLFIDCMGKVNGGWYHIDPGIVGTIADYNYVTGPSPTFDVKSGFNEENGINGGNPYFVSLIIEDFHLTKESLAIDAGTTINSFNYDREKTLRPQGKNWNIGAYEYINKTQIHQTPFNSRVGQ
jgi:hypothetical protein